MIGPRVPGPRAHVRLTLKPPRPDAKPWRLPNPTRSLLFRFGTGTKEEALAGAVLHAEGVSEISQGNTFTGSLEFWVDEVERWLRPGEPFDVWYGGDVGSGQVLDVNSA